MRKLIHGYMLATAFLVSGIGTTPAWALGWNDPEWTGLGCPSKLSGDWVPLTNSPYTGSKIKFKSNGATLSSKENHQVLFAFSPNTKDKQFLNLQRVSNDSIPFPAYLKIRPYIAIQSISKGRKYTLCKIKLFLFESQQKANQMSYVSWDIYSTIDSIEVPHGN